MQLRLSHPSQVARLLTWTIALLVVAHALGLISTHALGHNFVKGLVPLFDMDHEPSVPTGVAIGLFLTNVALLLSIGRKQRQRGQASLAWFLMAIVFVYLAIDELMSLHERLGVPVREALGTSGLLYYAWIIPYAVGLAILAIPVVPVLAQIPFAHLRWLLLACVLFLSGSLGFEMIGGYVRENSGRESLLYDLATAGEETLELCGLAVFVFGLTLFRAGLKHQAPTP